MEPFHVINVDASFALLLLLATGLPVATDFLFGDEELAQALFELHKDGIVI